VSEPYEPSSAKDRNELRQLASAMCDGTLTDEQHARLEAILQDSEEARLSYAIYMRMNGWLMRQFRSRTADGAAPSGDGTPPSGTQFPVLGVIGDALRGAGDFFSRPIPLSYLIASVLLGSLLTLLAVMVVPRGSNPDPLLGPSAKPTFVAHLTGTDDAQWADPNMAPAVGWQLPTGKRLDLLSGLVEITYDVGAKVILEGPAAYEIDSANGGFLRVGKLTATAATKESRGFVIRTPTVSVADLGTEFGVEVADEHRTEVEVFVGAVRLTSRVAQDRDAEAPILREGQAASFDAKSSQFILGEPATGREERFARTLPVPERPRETLLLADNFDEDAVDPAKWLVDTSNPWGKAAVVQQNGRVELANRGMLITKSQYSPRVHDAVKITGQWTFVTSGEMPNMDIMTVTIHSTGEPAGRYGQATGGLAFFCYAGLDFLDIQYLGNGFLLDFVKRTGKLRIREGESYRFEIMDGGDTVSFRVTNAGDPSQTASVTAKVSGSWNHNHVVFHNREYHGGDGYLSSLDHVNISATLRVSAADPPAANTD